MKRRTLDIIFSVGGVVLAVGFLALGLVLWNEGSWGDDYVADQLGEQKIVFATMEELEKDEANPENTKNIAKITEWRSGSACLEKYAGQTLETGKQAECYGRFYIGMHMARSAANMAAQYNEPLFNGATYATLGNSGELRLKLNAQINPLKDEQAKAKAAGDTAKADALQKEIDPIQKQIDSVTSLRSTMQTGETLKGLLLTTYGFSIFGDRATLVAQILMVLAGVMVLLSVAGFVHAFVTPREKVVGIVATTAPPTDSKAPQAT